MHLKIAELQKMDFPSFKRLPEHIGIIPDGNRRWAQRNGLGKQDGYKHGVGPGLQLYNICDGLRGVREITFYGFTQDNTKRPAPQTDAFRQACVEAVLLLAQKDVDILVVGNTKTPLFPAELLPFTKRDKSATGRIKVNFLINYGWNWDLNQALDKHGADKGEGFTKRIASSGISRIDLVIRWGSRRRLSGFLPIQTIYSDFYVVDELWPEFRPEHIYNAFAWYQDQDITLGG
ncbi:MAG: undecaprenyl diphosphate synthase family protein [Desulfobulbaceae bacterium]|nr:undecaprenyl diphosphate synthase family protein [Desulfobulbaceae bacterium]